LDAAMDASSVAMKMEQGLSFMAVAW